VEAGAEAGVGEEADGTWVMGDDGRWRWEIAADGDLGASSVDECILESDSAAQLVECAAAGVEVAVAAAVGAAAAVVAEGKAEAVVAEADECIAESETAGELVECAIAGALDDLFTDDEVGAAAAAAAEPAETEEQRIDRTMAALFAAPAELEDEWP